MKKQKIKITSSGISIQTKYLRPTNSKGARIKAFRTDKHPDGHTESVTVCFDHGARDPHDTAAIAWFEKYWPIYEGKNFPVKVHRGSVKLGRVYTVTR